MAEAVGLAGSIVALLDAAAKIYSYLRDVKGAGKEGAQLRLEIKSLEVVLIAIKEMEAELKLADKSGYSPDDKWFATFRALNDTQDEGPIGQLTALLKYIESAVHKMTVMKRLLWPFKKDEVNQWLSTMDRHKATLVLALQNDSGRLNAAIYRTVREGGEMLRQFGQRQEKQEHRAHEEEKQKLLKWLSGLDHASGHRSAKAYRLSGTGQWLLKSEEFGDWLSGSKKVLYCPGIPGAGKTVIASTVIDYLKDVFSSDRTVGVAYVYYKYDRPDEQNPNDLTLSLARQLTEIQRTVPTYIEERYKESKENGIHERPSEVQSMEMLQAAVRQFKRVFFVIDALDECRKREDCRDLMNRLFPLDQLGGVHVHIMATARDVDRATDPHFSGIEVVVKPIGAHSDDILLYIARVMLTSFEFEFRKTDRRHVELQEEIKTVVLKSSAEVFLLAQLEMDMLKDLVTVGEIKETLRVLESGDVGLDEIYKASMKRIKGQNPAARKRALRILSWISHAKRPLTAEELRYALAVNEGDTALNGDHLIPEEHITRVCAGLIRIEQGVGKISWIHDTARAYFESHRQVLFPDTEKVISRVCLTYLCFDTFASGPCKKSEEFSQWLESWPFLNYAATHWGSHLPAEMASDYLVMHFLEKKEHVETAGQVLLAPRRTASRGYEIAGTFGTTPVHLSAYFGLLDAAKELLLKGYPSDEEDSAGCTPLSYAAENGHREVVSLMLSNGARPDAAYATSSNERTPLSFAAENGHEDVTRLLLDFGASPTPRRRRRASKPTPLTYASGNGHLVIVNLLLQAHEPDEPWDDNEMALSAAAEEGHVEIVRALLDKGCHPDLKWERGNNRLGTRFRTPLSYAAGAGHASVVHLLLERGGNVETYDNSNRTPLFFAAEKGDMHVIDILLQKGNADVNVADYQGNTPLSRAVDRGDIEVVKELLDRGANPDTSRTSSEIQVDSPLLSAVSAGRTELVRLLIGTGKVRTDPTEDWDGTSALCYAAKLGYRDIVQLLLQGANVRLNHETSKGRTPLSFAAASGHKDIVKILIETQGIDADRRDRKGRTPLSHAAYNGHEDVVRILLAHPDVNPENEDNSGHTPLYCAFLGRHTNIIRVLLDETSGRVNPETEDQDGLTQLAQASRDGNLEAVEFLLSLDVVKPDSKDKKGRTPFLHAASNGHLDVVKALLHTSKVNVNLVDVDGASAIHHAARYHHGSPYDKGSAGHDEVLAFLLDTCAPKLADLPDKKGRSPLTYAAKAGRAAAVSMLIATPHANACHRDDNGREPLSYAAQKGTAGIIQTILNVVVVNINAVDNEGKTALWWLVYGESARVTKRRFFSLAGRIQAKTEALQVLLQHNSLDINAATLSGAQTPLMLAAETGVEPMLRVILGDKRTDPNAKDANNRTALQIAVQQGHSGCVEALLGDLRVSLSPSCTGGWTPLWWAAQYGYEQITKLCLDKPDVDPNAADENGRTPLAFAVETYQKGRFENEEDKTGVVKLLLTHHSLDPNIKDKQGRTPLRVAEGYGKYRGETMRLLLADNRVDPSAMLPEWTPLWWLCQRADEEAMRLLFRRPDLDLDSRDAYGRSPLSYAAEGGSEEIVTALLASGKVDPETRDNEGFSPLFRAIAELEEDWDYKTAGLIRIIKLLLAQEAVRLDFRGETAWKPKKSYSQKPDPILVWAVKQGDAEILRLMLEKKQADPNAEDEDGASALWHAADKRNKEMAEMLLKIDGVEVNKKITQGRTPFFIAVQTSPAIARKLFGTGSVDLESRDEYGRTAILRALEGPTATFEGVTEVINFLLRLGANPDVADVCGRTPLSYAAASYTFHEVLRILLNTEGVDPNSVDSIGMTPLSYAAGNDNSDGVKILLADERVDVGIMDNNGLTALDHAEAYFAKTYSVILLRRRMGLPDICYDDLEWEEVNQARQTPSA